MASRTPYRPPKPGQTTPRMAARQAALAAGAAGRFTVTTKVNPGITQLHKMFDLDSTALGVISKLVDDRFRVMMSTLYPTQGASGGNQWAPLSPEYLKKKKIPKWFRIRAGRGAILEEVRKLPARYRVGLFRLTLGEFKILQLTRRLRLSLTSKNTDHILETGKSGQNYYIVLGTTVPYSIHHWKGGRSLPRRNPIQRTSAQDAELGQVVVDAVRAIADKKIRMIARVA